MKINLRLFTTLVVLLFFYRGQAQVAISNISELEKIKGGTTYVAMNDPKNKKNKEFIEIFRKNWTFSKLEFIKYTDIENYFSAENSFITLSGYETNVSFFNLYTDGSRSGGIDYSHTHIYLELWNCTDKYLKNEKKKELKRKDKNQIVRLELFTDFPTLLSPENLFKTDYDSDNHIRNWGKGFLQNYIQNMVQLLNNKVERKLFTQILKKEELKKLATSTLYIPDYALTKFNNFTGDESKMHDEKDIMEDYKLSYKIITTKELNNKILEDKTGFYYLQYVKSSTDKFISIINSLTGEEIYTNYVPVSYNIKSGDLKTLSKEILK